MALEIQRNNPNYSEIPLIALRHSTRCILSQMLNGTKVLPSPSNLPRDWRGIAHLACVRTPHINSPDPTAFILSAWEKDNPSIQSLLDALKDIDRWDVIDDITDLIDNDTLEYLKIINNKKALTNNEEHENSVLTVDDVHCIESCGQPQYYDAFLLFDDSDKDFALTILAKLENEYGLKLCTKDRDLIGGLPFEHEAIMQLIRDRCRRLIVVVSPTFLESPANKFLLTFAQAIGIEQQQRKIIPCMYMKFKLPLQLNYYCVLDFTRSSSLWNFWDRLSQSIASQRPAILPAQSYAQIEAAPTKTDGKENEPLTADKWQCVKASETPSAPPAESDASIPKLYSKEKVKSSITKADLESVNQASSVTNKSYSTTESLSGLSESEPILKESRTSSRVSLLSRVFVSGRMVKPKKWFKKKNKAAITVQS